ncbi:MAG: hypothetical protein H6738_23070 [Alphaproteobacteria bacterium]|nr:hypothetical protein [Alphaproteobacteria bacterium]MCB9699686.1 hypothetical protein [Alphaproteobacteria bacterium]
MTEPTVNAELDRLQNRYRVRFAGHARVSRDPDELEDIVEELERLAPRATGEDAARLERDRELYANEVKAIREAHAVPGAVAAARLRMWADIQLARYNRMFAGQDRRTRDTALLEEIRDGLGRLKGEMAKLHQQAPEQGIQQAIATVDRSQKLYDDEVTAIRAVRRTGALNEQGSRFANLANDQFAVYADLFAGQPRLSRHAPTLMRIVRSLEELLQGMRSLRLAGLNDKANDGNQGIVKDRIDQYRREHEAILDLQRKTSLDERVSALATAANQVFAEYREHFANKPRASADPMKLAAIAEKLWPIAREMDVIDHEHGEERNARNLGIVTDNLALYQKEWDAIRQARTPSANA